MLGAVGQPSSWDRLDGQVLLRAAEFVQRLTPLLRGKQSLCEISRRQRFASRPFLAGLLSAPALRDEERRDHTLRAAHVEHGYTLAEIGDAVGLDHATANRVANKSEGWREGR